jgi:predicted  nucleic acid-binding Zn-ribbon protein
MVAISLDKLLVLQERDSKRLSFEQQLKSVPREIASVEGKITAEKAAIETAKAEWHGLESKKKQLEMEIGGAEEKIGKYRTQQNQVRKNDEYQALTHEIETAQTAIGQLEEQEIGIMISIDEAKKKFAAAEAELKANIKGHEAKIHALREREKNLLVDVKSAQDTVAAARLEVPAPQLKIYDRVASKPGHPVCVPVTAARCGGCHLKVSANVEMEARKLEEVTTCDQCGRIVYWTS